MKAPAWWWKIFPWLGVIFFGFASWYGTSNPLQSLFTAGLWWLGASMYANVRLGQNIVTGERLPMPHGMMEEQFEYDRKEYHLFIGKQQQHKRTMARRIFVVCDGIVVGENWLLQRTNEWRFNPPGQGPGFIKELDRVLWARMKKENLRC